MNPSYTRYELLRTFRNKRFLIFSLGFPLVLYFVIAGPNRGEDDFAGTGIPVALYYMTSLVAFGGMSAMLSSGARIAAERQVGWNRQLRISPLRPRTYFRAKVVTAYLLALVAIASLYLSGIILGVSLPAGRWIEMTALLLVGLVPFAAMGVVLGHVASADSVGPLVGGLISLFALLGGTWFPIGTDGVTHYVAVALPSYWLVQASHVSLGGAAWGAGGWLVLGLWTVVLLRVAVVLYRRDTRRAYT